AVITTPGNKIMYGKPLLPGLSNRVTPISTCLDITSEPRCAQGIDSIPTSMARPWPGTTVSRPVSLNTQSDSITTWIQEHRPSPDAQLQGDMTVPMPARPTSKDLSAREKNPAGLLDSGVRSLAGRCAGCFTWPRSAP